jgi:beta-1,4-mannosyl-glycoprotein beta-1,4-N-acetylglucosaminyltransferase
MNELELLDIRLHELKYVVDKFILVECTKTHSGKDKPLFFEENRDSFSDYLHKIKHIIVEDIPLDSSDNWIRENFHRNCIVRGLAGCENDDIIIVSDADEIPRAERVLHYTKNPDFGSTLVQQIHYYYLNCYNHSNWCGSTIFKYSEMIRRNRVPQWYRDHKDNLPKLLDGGWHFAYLGGEERIRYKLESFAHQEFNVPQLTSPEYIQERLKDGGDFYRPDHKLVFRDVTSNGYPDYLKLNSGKFKHLIK